MTGGTPALVHSLPGVMCLGLCLVQSSQFEGPRLPDNGEHLSYEFEFDGIQGLSLYVFVFRSVSKFTFIQLSHLCAQFNRMQGSHRQVGSAVYFPVQLLYFEFFKFYVFCVDADGICTCIDLSARCRREHFELVGRGREGDVAVYQHRTL